MPRTLTTKTETHRLRADVGWLRLLTVTLYRDRFGGSPASLTLYFSDATRYLPISGGGTREYLPLVLEWGPVGDSLEAVNATMAPASLNIRLSNVVPIAAGGSTWARFTDLLREGTNTTGYDKAECDVVFAWCPPDGEVGPGGDEVEHFWGRGDTVAEGDEAVATLRATSLGGGFTIPILDAGAFGGCTGETPAWLVGKAFAREIEFEGDIVAGVPNFGLTDTGTSWEIDAAYVAGFGVAPPILRDSESLAWNDLRNSINANRWSGRYYIYARDPSGPFTGEGLPWFDDGTVDKFRNFSSIEIAPGTDQGLTGDIEILELEDIPSQAAFDGLKPSNPPTVKRVIATLTPPPTPDMENPTPVQWPDAPTVDVRCCRFLAIRPTVWLTEVAGDDPFPASPEILSFYGFEYELEIS